MIGKIAYLLAFLVTIAVVVEPAPESLQRIDRARNQSHDLFVGYPVAGDRLVHQQRVLRQRVYNQIVTAQQTFYINTFERITRVIARDQQMNGFGGYASLLKGGPGTNNATILFRSQRGYGINFVVEIYAKR